MKVLLIDDQPLILSALRAVVRDIGGDFTVVGVDHPADAHQLLQRESDFDLALLALNLDDASGFEVLATMRRRHPGLPVVVVSEGDRAADVIHVVDMGAMGYVPRGSGLTDLRAALGMVMSGGIYIPPGMLGLVRRSADEAGDTVPSVMRPGGGDEPGSDAAAAAAEAAEVVRRVASAAARDHAMAPAPPAPSEPAPLLPRPPGPEALGLTPRQADVLALLLRGLPNKLIARELSLSVDTVKDHVAAVLRALGVASRTQAVLAVSQLTITAQGLPGWGPREP
ncbi:response regulator [Aquabacterium sp.]|uniref:response regulator transcription factor n=1 Tax=Aquabacterium sp. TaxID=1872578 RepID=UPI003784F510